MISEQFMQLGRWDLRLSPDTPMSIREELVDRGVYVSVTPNRAAAGPGLTGADVQGIARWTGWLRWRSEDNLAIGGHGPAYYAYTRYQQTTAGSSRTWTQHLAAATDLFIGGGLWTYDTPVSVPATTWPNAGGSSDDLPTVGLDYLNYLASVLDCEWYFKPDQSMSSGGSNSSSLFQTTPQVILVRGHEGRDLDLIGLRTVKFDRTFDTSEHAYLAAVDGVGVFRSVSDTTYGVNGRNLLEVSTTIDNNTDADNRATAMLTDSPPEDRLTVSVDTYDVGRWMKLGDSVWAYDPRSNVYDNTEATTYHGMHITPAKKRVYGMTWPVQVGMGVYAWDFTNLAVVDLTDYVQYETGTTALDLGAHRRFYNQ